MYLVLFYRYGCGGSESLSSSSKLMQLLSGVAWPGIQRFLTPDSFQGRPASSPIFPILLFRTGEGVRGRRQPTGVSQAACSGIPSSGCPGCPGGGAQLHGADTDSTRGGTQGHRGHSRSGCPLSSPCSPSPSPLTPPQRLPHCPLKMPTMFPPHGLAATGSLSQNFCRRHPHGTPCTPGWPPLSYPTQRAPPPHTVPSPSHPHLTKGCVCVCTACPSLWKGNSREPGCVLLPAPPPVCGAASDRLSRNAC